MYIQTKLHQYYVNVKFSLSAWRSWTSIKTSLHFRFSSYFKRIVKMHKLKILRKVFHVPCIQYVECCIRIGILEFRDIVVIVGFSLILGVMWYYVATFMFNDAHKKNQNKRMPHNVMHQGKTHFNFRDIFFRSVITTHSQLYQLIYNINETWNTFLKLYVFLSFKLGII